MPLTVLPTIGTGTAGRSRPVEGRAASLLGLVRSPTGGQLQAEEEEMLRGIVPGPLQRHMSI